MDTITQKNVCFLRFITTHLPGKYTAAAIIEAYHLEAISHHSAPNWTVCLLHSIFHSPPSRRACGTGLRNDTLCVSLSILQLKQSSRSREHGSYALLTWLIAFTLCVCEGTWQTRRGPGIGLRRIFKICGQGCFCVVSTVNGYLWLSK